MTIALEVIRTVSLAFTGIMTLVITIMIHKYSRRKDRLEFQRFRWAEQQQINLAQLNHPDITKTFERMVNGDDHVSTPDEDKRLYHAFLHINQVQHLYLAYMHGMMSKKRFEELSGATLRLIKREENLVKFLLDNRGYSEDFSKAICKILNAVEPYRKINWKEFS